ncbi:MAG: maleylacetoacetate isomerase [Gammaproteobacteria bacterium]|nr:maleylacetoacetate isomerase [Gammaproteobacteria bacterium]
MAAFNVSEAKLRLYDYFRSSAAYRVRIALNLKGIPYTQQSVNLLAGEQDGLEYGAINPQGVVPSLEIAPGDYLYQSLAILEWIEERYPEPALLPADPLERARVRALAMVVACDIHPLNIVRVLRYLENELEVPADARSRWYTHWIQRGFHALETQLSAQGPFCRGAQLSLADVCLVPQVFNARRFEVPLDDFPRIVRSADHCNGLEPFARARPENQPDAR